MDDTEEFGLVKHAMSALAIDDKTQLEVFKIVAGLMHLGQVEFAAATGGEDSSVVDPKCTAAVASCAELLGVPADQLGQKLIIRVRELRGGESVTSNNTPSESRDLRDALAKVRHRFFGMEWNGMEWNGMEWNGMECSARRARPRSGRW